MFSQVVGLIRPRPKDRLGSGRVRDVVVREPEVLLRSWVVGALAPDAADLPDLPLDLLHDVVERDDAIFVRRRRREELEQVVAALSSHFEAARDGSSARFT